jgi:hypothetical protein
VCCAAHQRHKLESQGQGRVPERQRSWLGPKAALLGAPRTSTYVATLPAWPLLTSGLNGIAPAMSFVLQLKTGYEDGATHIVMSLLDSCNASPHLFPVHGCI